MPSNSKPVQILIFLALVLFLLNFFFDEKFGNRAVRVPPPLKFENFENLSEKPENLTRNGYLSSRLATTARLANHIFEIVSIYGMSKTLHRQPAIFVEDLKYQKLIDGIQKIFPALLEKFVIFKQPVPSNAEQFLLSDICCIFDDPQKINNRSSEYLHLTGHFYQSWRYFDEFRWEIQNFVKPPVEFEPLPVSDESNFVTCIHIRRTDFVDGEHHSSNETFTRKALEFIENSEKAKNSKIEKMKTVIMGDDSQFEEKIFPDTKRAIKGTFIPDTTKYFVSMDNPQNDLAYSRYHCNAVLITAPSSTFGWWLGYISKGQSVYYQDIRSTNDVNFRKGHLKPEDYFPPRWTSMKLDGNERIEIVSK